MAEPEDVQMTPEQLAKAFGEMTPEQQQQFIKTAPAVAEAIDGSKDEADARRRAQEAVSDTVDGISDADAKKVADYTIDALKQAGAFDAPPAPDPDPVPPPPPPPGPQETHTDPPPPPDPAPPAPPAPPVEEPRKKTFAERFAGG